MLSARGSCLRGLRQLCAPPARLSRSGRGRSHSLRGTRCSTELMGAVIKGLRNSDAMPGGTIMRKYFILPLLLVLAMGLIAPLAFAQITGSVKGVCKDDDGKPIAGAEVEWLSTDTGHKYTLKTNNKGEYFSLGINPGRYNVTLYKDGKQLFYFKGIPVSVDETTQDFDLKKEHSNPAVQGMTPEQAAKVNEANSK